MIDIKAEPRVVTWTRRGEVCIGVKSCEWCATLTPDPTDEQVIEFIKKNPHTTTMWPFGGENYGEFIPSGWRHVTIDADGSPESGRGERGMLCPDCVGRLRQALADLKSGKDGRR